MNCNICGHSIAYGEEWDYDDWDAPAHVWCLDDYEGDGYDY